MKAKFDVVLSLEEGNATTRFHTINCCTKYPSRQFMQSLLLFLALCSAESTAMDYSAAFPHHLSIAVSRGFPMQAEKNEGRFFLPSVEGLRFIAFLLIFFHHLPHPTLYPTLSEIMERGSIGIEVFFTISAFLLFTLSVMELRREPKGMAGRFMLRRMLRVAPLLSIFVLACLIYTLFVVPFDIYPFALARSIGLVLFFDNFVCWLAGYSPLPHTAHLWTLSFEMQFYPFIPILAGIALARGRKMFLAVALIAVVCFLARAVFVILDAKHPLIWVTPFLRPESILIGILLAYAVLNGVRSFAGAAVCVLALAVATYWIFPMNYFGVDALARYVVTAIVSGALLWCTLFLAPLRWIFATAPFVFLGRISYGLYVFHYPVLAELGDYMKSRSLDLAQPLNLVLLAILAFFVTVTLATVSWFTIERPFLRLKRRFEVVPSRPI